MTGLRSLPKQHAAVGIAALVCCACFFAYCFWFGERIQHNGGLGWDGAAYADWAQRNTLEVLRSRTISEYYIGRLIPSFVVHTVSGLMGYDITSTTGVIKAFFALNIAALLISLLLIASIANLLKWRWNIIYLAIAGLIFNYPVLVNLSYNPTLTDMSGYMLGLAIIHAHLRRNFAMTWLLSLLCGFVWPTMLYGSLLLIAFGNCRIEIRPTPRSAHLLAFAGGLSLLGLSAWLYANGLRQTVGTTEIKPLLLPICAALYVGYVYLAARPLADAGSYLGALKQIDWRRVAAAIFLLCLVKYISFHFSDHTPGPLTITSYIGLLTQASLANPLVNVVAHAMHYGPLYLLAIFIWPAIATEAKRNGLGLTLFMLLFAVLSIGSESRQFLNAWPALVVLACETLNRMEEDGRIDWWFTYTLAVVALITSRFWLKINVGPWTGNFQQFPDQMLYMYTGPWMSDTMYSVFLAVTLLCAMIVANLLRKRTT